MAILVIDRQEGDISLLDLYESLEDVRLRVSDLIFKRARAALATDTPPVLEVFPGGLKVTVYALFPKLCNRRHRYNKGYLHFGEHSRVRKLWFNMISRALEGYKAGLVQEAVIITHYYAPYICDIDNYSVKFIIDALAAYGAIGPDDFRHVKAIIQTASMDKNNPRTEVTVLRYNRKIAEAMLQLSRHGNYGTE